MTFALRYSMQTDLAIPSQTFTKLATPAWANRLSPHVPAPANQMSESAWLIPTRLIPTVPEQVTSESGSTVRPRVSQQLQLRTRAGSTITSPHCCDLTQASRRFMQSNAPDGLTFMSTCLFDIGLDTFLFVPYFLLCYYAYQDVSRSLLQPRLSSIFDVQPGKEFTVSLRLLANVYCWYIVGVICTKRLAEGTLIDNDSIQICLYLL